ncbi:MAG: hypothetical protein H7288_25835 [Kineosporiaceae bacterium]|nr:hypothetical protein [Aeromicrobium sp.]
MENDPVGARLVALVNALTSELGTRASVSVQEEPNTPRQVDVIPRTDSALPVGWIELGSELILQAGHHGGRWELKRELEQMDFLEDVVRSVIDGRVTEVFAPGRSRVEVTLRDGSVVAEAGYATLRGCLPLPGWVRRGRRVHYAPYAE